MSNNRHMALASYTIGDAVTSLIYASAVNVILSRSVGIADSYHYWGIGIILFIFVDWLSRVGIPMTFSESADQERRRWTWIMLSKAGLEISLMYFFVAAAIMLCFDVSKLCLPAGTVKARTAFAAFLGISFCWNGLMFKVMTRLTFLEVLGASIAGCVFDLEGSDIYTRTFKDRVNSARNEKQKRPDNFHWVLFREGFGRTAAQLVGHHITWVNAIASVILFLGISPFPFSQYSGGLFGDVWVLRIVIFFLLILFPSFLYFLATAIAEGTTKEAIVVRLAKKVSALFLLALLITFYATFDGGSIIYVMIVEHTAFGVFLLFATHPNGSGIDQKTETPAKEKSK